MLSIRISVIALANIPLSRKIEESRCQCMQIKCNLLYFLSCLDATDAGGILVKGNSQLLPGDTSSGVSTPYAHP